MGGGWGGSCTHVLHVLAVRSSPGGPSVVPKGTNADGRVRAGRRQGDKNVADCRENEICVGVFKRMRIVLSENTCFRFVFFRFFLIIFSFSVLFFF